MRIYKETDGNFANFTNSQGCNVSLAVRTASDFCNQLARYDEGLRRFVDAISHKLIDVAFLDGRKIYLQICGYRLLSIPKKCKTLQDVAEWINNKDF